MSGARTLPTPAPNPFDQFDGQPPAAPAGRQPNPFDQFDGQPAMLPNGAVLDDQHPNSAANWAGAITRGALDGLTGLADLTTTPLARGVNDLTRAASPVTASSTPTWTGTTTTCRWRTPPASASLGASPGLYVDRHCWGGRLHGIAKRASVWLLKVKRGSRPDGA